jgi:hypothetical protein
MKTIVAFYDHLQQAELALRELQASGVPRERMNLVATMENEAYRPYFDEQGRYWADIDHILEESATRATPEGVGALTGVGSLLTGLGLLMIPAVGPILAAGPLLAGAAGAGAGAASEGLHGLLVHAGVSQHDAEAFAQAVQRGGALLLLTSPAEHVEQATSILARHHPVDVEERRHAWSNSAGAARA